jgi:hypothetical protein
MVAGGTPDYLDDLRAMLAKGPLCWICVDDPAGGLAVEPVYTALVDAGWLLALIKEKYPPPPGTLFTRWTTSALNVRKGPGTKYEVLRVLGQGDEVQVDLGKVTASTNFAPLVPGPGFVFVQYLSATKA